MALLRQSFTNLTDIKGFKTSWKIQVKIIHTWKQYLSSGETIELVLADQNGTLIHATVKKHQIRKFQSLIVAGEWRIIEHFTLSNASGKFRPTKHPYKMAFMDTTKMNESALTSNELFLDFANFEDIADISTLNENILIDVIGQVVNLGELETPIVANKPSKKLQLELRNTRDDRLVCTLWGKFAVTMWNACHNGGSDIVVCLLRFAKINSYKGERTVSSAFDISILTINPTYPEAVEFIDNLPKDGLGLTIKVSVPKAIKEQEKQDLLNSLPRKTISEILTSTYEGKYRILCTVYGIDADWSWYYFCCLKCSKTAYKVPKVENEKVQKDKKPLFWCGTCRENTTRVEPRYKLILHVMDSTGQTKIMLFDSHATKIVMSSALDLLEGRLDEMEDPTNLPQGLVNLKGKTFQFVVNVESDNISDYNDTYKVGHVWLGLPNDQNESILESESTNDVTPQISVDQEAFMLTHSSEPEDSFGTDTKTPSSKRKDESPEGAADQSSVSKKLCLPSITHAFDNQDLGEGKSKSG